MARSLRYLFVLLFISVSGTALAQYGEISGTVLDETRQPAIGAIVEVWSGGAKRGGAAVDDKGGYVVSALPVGSGYEVHVEFFGYKKSVTRNVQVREGGSAKVNVTLEQDIKKLGETVITDYKIPIIQPGTVINSLSGEDIDNAGYRSTADAAVMAGPGIHSSRQGGDLNAFGGRNNATTYIIDGQVVSGTNVDLPQGMIGQLDVMSSGLSAKYGDATGAVINVTTRGPSEYLKGGVRLEHSFDGYNHNLGSVNLSGPLLSRKDSTGAKKTVVGFLVGAEGWYDKDRNPYYGGTWVVNDDVLSNVEQNPLTRSLNQNGTIVYKNTAEYINKSDMHKEKVRPNSAVYEGRANGKLDFQVADNLNLTAGGSFNYRKGSTLAEGINNGYRAYVPFDAQAIPEDINTTTRGYLRFTQKFGKGGNDKSVIQNAYYSIQADYELDHFVRQDPNFKKDIFDYGYVGKFDRQYAPGYIYSYDDSTKHYMYRLAGYRFPTQITYERSDMNPLLANYTSEYYNLNGTTPTDIVDVRANGAMMNGDQPFYAYTYLANTGNALSTYSYNNTNQFAVSADASFDLKLNNTRHSIQFGLYYQQRTIRSYSASANPSGQGISSLWEVMRSLQNSHLTNLDLANPMYRVNGNVYTWDQVKAGQIIPSIYDTVFYNTTSNLAAQSTFDKNLRKKLGLDPNGVDYLNVDGVDPSILSLDMFSPDELLNSGHAMVSYYGYDYTGKKQSGNVNFNDYFTEKDANGNFTRNIGANRPSYTAAYIQDHFRYKDLDFNIGVRVDRFDANTKVLKDPYSLYQENTVADVQSGSTGTANSTAKTPVGSIPANMGSNYVVYVDNNASQKPNIIGFRNGDDWYDAQGNVLQDPGVLSVASGGLQPQPFLKDPNQKINDTTGFDASTSFTDYKPQVNVAPRISFSFPVSSVANFYAHYDIIVQRPRGSRNYATPYDYYYLPQHSSSIIDNNDLKPEKMFDYEVGFQQRLTQQSGLTISGFYRERKDMIQVRPYLYAWPNTYYTYGNRDFSTTKGMTVSYDLRRFGNLRMKINYTLQFAEGTGSGDASGNGGNGNTVGSNGLIQNFIAAGVPNLRYVSDLDYDSRHMITASIDYRYGDTAGPVVGGHHILQNAGVNFNFTARSGEPYTKRLDANPSNRTVQGQINGSRLPWHYMVDMRLDKDFSLRSNKKPVGDEMSIKHKKPLSVGAFVYITNLFNIKDVISVYGYTGRPDDDGYLTSAQGIVAASTQTNAQSYQDIYSVNNDNPYNYNLPRRLTVGLNFNF